MTKINTKTIEEFSKLIWNMNSNLKTVSVDQQTVVFTVILAIKMGT